MSEYMLSKDYFVQVIRDLIVLAEDRKEYFTDLDSAIGDGDHGINLSIGFREVRLVSLLQQVITTNQKLLTVLFTLTLLVQVLVPLQGLQTLQLTLNLQQVLVLVDVLV